MFVTKQLLRTCHEQRPSDQCNVDLVSLGVGRVLHGAGRASDFIFVPCEVGCPSGVGNLIPPLTSLRNVIARIGTRATGPPGVL